MSILMFCKRFVAVTLFLLICNTLQAQNLPTYINSVIPATGLNLTLDSVVFYSTATSGDVSSLRDSVFYHWVYPDGIVSGEDITVSNVFKMGLQTGLDTARVSDHMSFLSSGARSLQSGDMIYKCYYKLLDSTYGMFTFYTLGYENSSGVIKFEPFIGMCPLHFSDYIKTTKPGAAHDVEFEVKNGFGFICASGWGDCKITCDGNNVVDCFGLVGGDACFLWEYEITKDCATVGNCCRCIFRFGFANGFSSVGVGVDGVSIELSGSFGLKGSTESVVKRCCPTGAMVAFNFAPQNSNTVATLYSVSTVSSSVGWTSGSGTTVLRTTNSGINWISASGTGLAGDIYNINAVSATTAFCTSTPSTVTFIYKTIDGGATWNTVYSQPGGFINAIQMINPTTGFAMGDPQGGKWTILKTVDGGNSWNRIPTEPVQMGAQNGWSNCLRVDGPNIRFGTNSQMVYHSPDNGITWNFSNTPGTVNSYAVHFNDPVFGLAGGDALTRSTNSGISYVPTTMPPSLSDVYGLEGSGPEWWAVGSNHTVYMSASQGARWNSVYTQTLEGAGTYLGAIDLTDFGSTGWIVGDGGVIIRVGNISQEASLNLTGFIEGFYDSGSNTQTGDTIEVFVRNTAFPFAVVTSDKAYLNSSGNASLNFANMTTGSYYLQVRHRSALETWSSAGVLLTVGGTSFYNFSTSPAQAYGSNLMQADASPLRYAFYSGDVNQDGTIDATDVSLIDNDAYNFVCGYVATDVNGDGCVDGSDALIADNNAYNFISVIAP
ncbi:MAG: hypothetical protein K1X85_10260 [Ignavibacteria bacterium]|nr:hypothetical protein [Ignavibacteria bacterium]